MTEFGYQTLAHPQLTPRAHFLGRATNQRRSQSGAAEVRAGHDTRTVWEKTPETHGESFQKRRGRERYVRRAVGPRVPHLFGTAAIASKP